MRIGTWNLAGRWTPAHEDLLRAQACDVWLLTEVNARVTLDGHEVHRSTSPMQRWKSWAAVATRLPLEGLPDPHPASAAARVAGITFVSSILPWKGCGAVEPWVGATHIERALATVNGLRAPLAEAAAGGLIWGGDWNHALTGKETAGSMAARRHLEALLGDLGLVAPTASLAHAIEGLGSIDHIAVPEAHAVVGAHRIAAEHDGKRLSDHDAYVVELAG